MAVFMTGATGFLGRYIARSFLDKGQCLFALVRNKDAQQAKERLLQALIDTPLSSNIMKRPDVRERIVVCRGSLDQPHLGLSVEDRNLILSHCDEFVHCGASVSFSQNLRQARAINVNGTQVLLKLAEERQHRAPLKRFDHISTAFVAGRRHGKVLEDDLDGSYGHKNTYELSKYEAEMAIHRQWDHLPITIYRPSIIVGDSHSGHTTSFRMLYWPVKIYSRGIWRSIPGKPETVIDIVPVDFVRDAFFAIRKQESSLQKTYHLAAGPENSLTLAEICMLISNLFPERKPAKIFNPWIWMHLFHPILKYMTVGRLRRILRAGEVYLPYFIDNPVFDNSQTKAALSHSEVSIPSVEKYLKQIFQFAVATNWGKKKIPNQQEVTGTPSRKLKRVGS